MFLAKLFAEELEIKNLFSLHDFSHIKGKNKLLGK